MLFSPLPKAETTLISGAISTLDYYKFSGIKYFFYNGPAKELMMAYIFAEAAQSGPCHFL